MTGFLKWLGIHVHDWGKWEMAGQITVASDKRVVGTSQKRVCNTCGFTQFHKQYRV